MGVSRHQGHKVYTKQYWADSWIEQVGLYCDKFSNVAGPDVSEASLSYEYGRISRAADEQFSTYAPFEINGWYVKIELAQIPDADPRKWIGIVVETQDDRHGTLQFRGDEIRTGKQTILCRGLEFLLQREELRSSIVRKDAETELEVGRAIGFNLGQGRDSDHWRKANLDPAGGERGPVFAQKIGTDANEWTAWDIVEYLFSYYPPKDTDGERKIPWSTGSENDARILLALKPLIQAEGKTIFAVLNEAIDRRRLVGWRVRLDSDDKPELDVFTFNATELSLPGGETVPANDDQATWDDLDDLNQYQVTSLTEDDATRYHVCIARGEPLICCFTIGDSLDGTLEKDWHATSETEYETAATGASDYGSLTDGDKADRNAAFRRQDKYAKVYSFLRLKSDWDGMIGSELAMATQGDSPTEVSPFWWAGLRFLDKLPLLTDRDYSAIDNAAATDRTIDASQPEYRRPFAVVDLGDDVGYQFTDKMARDAGWSLGLRMQDDVPGVILDVHGASQHVIASADFSPAEAAGVKQFDDPAELDWRDILVTVAVELDERLQAFYPEDSPLDTDDDAIRRLWIEVPRCRLDYVAVGTVVGIDDEGALIESDGGYVRDDRDLLRDIARSAYEWYGQTRKALTVVQRNLITNLEVGTLITTVGADEEEVNSVVTKLEFDLVAGTVTVQTQFGELDLTMGF